MSVIEKADMQKDVVYMSRVTYLKKPKIEISTLNKDGEKISALIPKDEKNSAEIFVDDSLRWEFPSYVKLKNFLKTKEGESGYHSILFSLENIDICDL